MAIAEYYNHASYPAAGSFGSSSGLRAEFEAIENGISAKLPDLAGNGGEVVTINAGATGLESISTTGTGSSVRSSSPTLTTPTFAGYAPRMDIGNVASGGTVTLSSAFPQYVNIGAGTKASLGFDLPAASLVDFQVQGVSTVGAITSVTVNGGGATVSGAPTTLAANGFFVLQYRLSTTTWYRVG